ncbi:orotate phosphoribosyltransferase [Candidatus Roizmanbacteria bacterium CG03_land_8_20_14_0_80_36_21]|nr:MAG: orotate phosphoribosyltransferase [Candidatus Roizmanbacteria bacterium CG03_land_8_20_14_0_80_36_21]
MKTIHHNLPSKERLILELFRIKAIEFGRFKLKSGAISPYYLDLRLLVSYPYLLEVVADVFWEELRLMQFDLLVGVPYAAIPLATIISYKYNRPMVFVRKEQKQYGKKKQIEGVFHSGQTAVLLDDVISDGKSKEETLTVFKNDGLKINDVLVLLDRRKQTDKKGEIYGCKLTAIYNMSEVIKILLKHGCISSLLEEQAKEFIKTGDLE